MRVTFASQLLATVHVTVIAPPHAAGAAGATGFVVTTLLHPPPLVNDPSHVPKAVFIAPCDWQAPCVASAGAEAVTAEAAVTVKVAVRVTFTSQLLATVHVTVVAPPQALGAAGATGFVVTTLLHPPPLVNDPSHVPKAVFIAACDWQAPCVASAGAEAVTAEAAVTVKVAVQFTDPQLLVAVQATEVVPPQALGATGDMGILVIVPVPEMLVNQVANFALISAWDWQAASVTLPGQVIVGPGFTVSIFEHVLVQPFALVIKTLYVPATDNPLRTLVVAPAITPLGPVHT
ncbi:MAG: hypothetical protein ABIP80_06910 [Ferruginibacter sp.]